MAMFMLEIRTCSDSVIDLVCTFDHLLSLTSIFDRSDKVIEYKISSGQSYFTNNNIPFPCDKLVEKFDWDKEDVIIPFTFS